jgi:hypothetical protein
MTVTVVQGAYHRRVNSSIQTVVADPVYNVPAAYTGEAIKEATFGNAITATANKVYNVALTDIAASPAAIADGTNQIAAVSIEVWQAGYSAVSAGATDFRVFLHRENTADGQDSANTRLKETISIGGVARIDCTLLDWDTTNVELKFSATATYEVKAKAFYYTPA